MKKVTKIGYLFVLICTVSSCLKYDNLRENPNNPLAVSPSLLFTAAVPGVESAFSDLYRHSQYHNFLTADLGVSPTVNYRYGSGSFGYGSLRNIDKMVQEAEKTNGKAYIILAKFLKAYYYVKMTQEMGDVPLTEAMQGAAIPRPKYDSQKSVYIQCLKWLDEANLELGNFITQNPGAGIDGDPYFSGNLKKWQKVINAFTIRVLISLSKKENEADVNVKSRFQAIMQDPAKYPLLTASDNMQLTHRDEDGFRSAYNPTLQINFSGIVYADTYIDMLKNYQDPRLFKVADPTPKALALNPNAASDVASYAGSDISKNLPEENAKRNNGEFSYPNKVRFQNFVGQPSILIGYPEQELNIAEAAHRGWITENAKLHYDNGITASMNFYGAVIGIYLTVNAPYIPGAAGLQRIHEQMYLALAENSGWTSWIMTRRTGVPAYKFSSVNDVTKLPVRWAYPTAENTENTSNYKAALVAQFGAVIDDRDQVMWLLQ